MFYKENSLTSLAQIEGVNKTNIIWELESTIEILEAQVESLKLELCYTDHELKEMQQELKYTNQELGAAINSKQLSLEQAEKLARNFLETEKSIKDALVELMTAIYNVPVKLDKLA